MRRKNQKLKTVRHFIIDGKEYLESEISEETKKKIYQELGRRAMEAVGFTAADTEADTAADTEGTPIVHSSAAL